MNADRIGRIEQVEQFLSASAPLEFSATDDDSERYGHISRVLKRFDYPRRGKRERGVLLMYLTVKFLEVIYQPLNQQAEAARQVVFAVLDNLSYLLRDVTDAPRLARTDPDAPRHKGLSVFIFPLAAPGVTVWPIYTMEGIRTNEVFLDQVRVPPSCMIGELNKGFYTIAVALDFERIFMGQYTKIRRNCDALVQCCKQAGEKGRSLYDGPVVQDQLVRIHFDIERLRLLSNKTAWMIDQGKVPNAEASAQKVLASELEQRVADEGMKILGPLAQLEYGSPHVPMHGHLTQAWLLAPMMRFAGGACEIQRDIIAQRGLGLPRS